MLHKLRQRAADERGFTLIELLVVILIIGILAAIALPSFISQRTKAQDTEAKSVARTAQTAFETQYTDAQAYTGGVTELNAIETAIPTTAAAAGKLSVSATGSGQSYTLTVTSVTGNTFTIAKADTGAVTRSCDGTKQPKGGCKGTSW